MDSSNLRLMIKQKTIDVEEMYGDNWLDHCRGCRALTKEHGEYFCIHDWQCPYPNRNNEED